MRLKYLSQEAINDVKMNFDRYKAHFLDKDNSWFINEFSKNNWIHESKIECLDFEMDHDQDYNISDRKNVEIVYNVLRDLSPALASDEGLWSGMLFTQLWKYVQYRREKELSSGNKQDILNSFVFMRGKKRSCFINCLSRLWWTGYLLYDASDTNHYKAVDLLCEKAYGSNIVLFSSSNFTANKNLALGVMDCIIERKKKGEKIGRYHFVYANKYLNCIGGVSLLDTMSREEVKRYADNGLKFYLK